MALGRALKEAGLFALFVIAWTPKYIVMEIKHLIDKRRNG